MSSRTTPHVAVLKGGFSAEREVSLVSGVECAAALREAGYRVSEVDAGASLVDDLSALAPDVVFNALHGRWGEDGCVQGLLEWLKLPYTHSGVLASSMAMDKPKAKAAFRAAGLPVAHSILAARSDVEARHVMPPPYVVKPYNEGSSVGVTLVRSTANGPPQLDETMPDTVMVEAYVAGRELSVAVLMDRALTVTDIQTDGWYDYHAKYASGGSRHVVPAEMPRAVFDACLDTALGAYRALGCRGLARADLRWDEDRGLDGLAILEINTQPGMTPTSLAPEQAAAEGHDFAALCRMLVEDASCGR